MKESHQSDQSHQSGFHAFSEFLDSDSKKKNREVVKKGDLQQPLNILRKKILEIIKNLDSNALKAFCEENPDSDLTELLPKNIIHILARMVSTKSEEEITEIVDFLLAQGIDINALDTNRELSYPDNSNEPHKTNFKAALHLAAQAGNIVLIKILLEKGAAIDIEGCYSALLYATEEEAEKLLKAKGAVAHWQNDDKYLIFALEKKDHKIAELLLKKGAKFSLTDEKLKNIFDADHLGIGTQMGLRSEYALPLVALRKQFYLLKLLLDLGYDPGSRHDEYKRTALHKAVLNSDFKILRLLLEKNDSRLEQGLISLVDIPDENGQTPLHLACRVKSSSGSEPEAISKNLQVFQELLKAWANFYLPDNNGLTPFHIAAQNGQIEMIEEMLKAESIDTQIQQMAGRSAKEILKLASIDSKTVGIMQRIQTIVEQMVKEISELPSNRNKAINKKTKEIFTEMLNVTSFVNDDQKKEITKTLTFNIHRFIKFIEQRVNIINKLCYEGFGAIHYAVINDHADVVDFLSEKGADIGSQDFNGNSTLHIAAQTNNAKAVILLLAKKPDLVNHLVNQKNKFGKTPLDLALASFSNEVADLLRDSTGIKKSSEASSSSQEFMSQAQAPEMMPNFGYQAQPMGMPHGWPVVPGQCPPPVPGMMPNFGYQAQPMGMPHVRPVVPGQYLASSQQFALPASSGQPSFPGQQLQTSTPQRMGMPHGLAPQGAKVDLQQPPQGQCRPRAPGKKRPSGTLTNITASKAKRPSTQNQNQNQN
jgi:ankyrin repeat protein